MLKKHAIDINKILKRFWRSKKLGFTLAEVLITLGIIGVVAAITIPIINNAIQDAQNITAYKKAFSDATNVWNSMIANNQVTQRTDQYDSAAGSANFNAFMGYFNIAKLCNNSDNASCWESSGEKLNNAVPGGSDLAFIDNSGRTWSATSASYAGEKIFVDTNGLKSPNKFGKDRFQFLPVLQGCSDTSGTCYQGGLPVKLVPGNDSPGYSIWGCQYPPCYPRKWLYQ